MAPGHKPDEPDLNLPYERYLREVVKELEKDENFQKKLSALDPEEVKVSAIICAFALQSNACRKATSPIISTSSVSTFAPS